MSTAVQSDIAIAQKATMLHIRDIAAKLGLKRPARTLRQIQGQAAPASGREGPVQIRQAHPGFSHHPHPGRRGQDHRLHRLNDGLNRIGKKSMVVLREPSLGPVFGIKGGATGGGYSQLLPMEDINLHFTGDFAAIEKANNLLAALIDNNLQSKNRSLNLDGRTVAWKRVMDMNDRSLRRMVCGLGGLMHGVPRETGFDITAASEIMAISAWPTICRT
jgi:Formate-tetrahydrofolate ligase (EC 6.3.4.3)